MTILDFFSELFHKAFVPSDDVSLSSFTIIAFLSAATVLISPLWHKTRFVITYVHEFGHAITSILTGGGTRGIKIHGDTSGVTETMRKRGPIGWMSAQLTTYIGYPFSGVVAFLFVFAMSNNYAAMCFFIMACLATFTIIRMRNLRGLGLAFLYASTLWVTFYFAPVEVLSVVLIVLSGFLFAGGIRTVIELQHAHHADDKSDSDVAALAHHHVPFEFLIFVTYYLMYLAALVGIVWSLADSELVELTHAAADVIVEL